MLFISFAKKPEPKRPKLPFKAIRELRKRPLTGEERRALLSHRVFGRLIRSRISHIASAQFKTLIKDFDKTRKGAALDKRLANRDDWLNKQFGQNKVSISNPAALGEKTRKLLSKRKVKKVILKYYLDKDRYYRELLKFAEKKQGIFQNCIGIINEKIAISEKELTRTKTGLEQY